MARQRRACENSRSSQDGYAAGSLLERLMHAHCLPARRLRWVDNPAELGLRLQQLVCLVAAEGAWRAYTDGTQWWFAVSKSAARISEDWTFDTWFFSEDGALCGAGSWRLSPGAGFVLTGIPGVDASSEWASTQLEHSAH